MERIWINWKDNCRKALSSVVAFLLVLVMYGCSGNSSDEPESEMLVLNATSLLIEADGADVTEFTVTKGNQDVTAAAEILQDGKVFLELASIQILKVNINSQLAITVKLLLKL